MVTGGNGHMSNMKFNQGISTIGLPVKYLDLGEEYEVIIRGTKGYGIDYGVCNGIEEYSAIASEENLGKITLELLKKSKEWEDSLLLIKPYIRKCQQLHIT